MIWFGQLRRSADLPNDDIGERTQSTGRQRRADLDKAIAPGLDVQQGFLDLFRAEGFILQTRFVGSDPFDHLAFVVFGEAFGAHLRLNEKNRVRMGGEALLVELLCQGRNRREWGKLTGFVRLTGESGSQ